MNKIKELIKDKKSILIFDVDGVLTPLEFGEYTHFILNDEEWEKSLNTHDYYKECRPIKKIKDFLQTKDLEKVYVVVFSIK